MAKLFLSYAREDAAIAARLARVLERKNHQLWWDRELHGGASFGTEIERQLRDCDVVIVLWSVAGLQSPWVRDEAAFGRDAGKLLPVSIDGSEPPLGFRQLHALELTRGRGKRFAVSKIEEAIARLAEGSPAIVGAESLRRRGSPDARWGWALAAAAILVIAAFAVWRISSKASAFTVAVVPSTTVGDATINRAYAASIGSDIASLLAAQSQNASVLDASAGEPRGDDFRFHVAVAAHGQGAEASTSLSVPRERRIIWSQEWTVPDLTKSDLKQQMAFAASRALDCALRGINGGLQGTLVNSYVTACAGFSSGDELGDDLVRIYAHIVKQAPNFGPGWGDLAVLYGSQALRLIYQEQPVPAALRRKATIAINNARRLNPNSGEAYMAEGALAGKDRLLHLKMMERAVEVEPNTAFLHAVLAHHLRTVGRMNESIEQAQKAVALDPLSSGARGSYIRALMEGGRISQATDELAKAERLWPNSTTIKEAALGMNADYGDPKRAEQLLPTLNLDDEGVARFRSFLRARENPTPANIRAAIANSKAVAEANPANAGGYLSVLAMFGKTDDAFAALGNPEYRRFLDSSTLFLPEFKQVRADARFMAVAAEFDLIRYWTVSGHWPDFCARPGLSYDCKKEAAKYV